MNHFKCLNGFKYCYLSTIDLQLLFNTIKMKKGWVFGLPDELFEEYSWDNHIVSRAWHNQPINGIRPL